MVFRVSLGQMSSLFITAFANRLSLRKAVRCSGAFAGDGCSFLGSYGLHNMWCSMSLRALLVVKIFGDCGRQNFWDHKALVQHWFPSSNNKKFQPDMWSSYTRGPAGVQGSRWPKL